MGSHIPGFSKMDRKNYGYPDLPKGYQISQYDLPLCYGGVLEFESGGETVSAGITRIHIEEDTGRLIHVQNELGQEVSLVDLNRSGVPLMEIVGDPDLRTPEQAGDYLTALRQILRAIGASTGNMEEGAFRCDANISIRTTDGSFAGPKVEIKNMNSFRSVVRALRFEEQRQRDVIRTEGTLIQETRGWVEASGVTVSQRTKEQAHDYRYFPEPDLPPLTVTADDTRRLADTVGELPRARRDRYVREHQLAVQDASLISSERSLATFFDETVGGAADADRARVAANWLVNDVVGLQKARTLPDDQLPITSGQLRDLIELVQDGKVTGRAGKELLAQLELGEDVAVAAARLNLLSLDDQQAIRAAALDVLQAFPAAVEDFRGGKTAAIGRLIGETIKRTGGRANPDVVRTVLTQLLKQ